MGKDHTLTATFRQPLLYLQLRTRLDKEKRPPKPIPATFVLSGSQVGLELTTENGAAWNNF
jgi:hypothetical protein